MRGYRKRPLMCLRDISVPLIGAALFFALSIVLLISYKGSAYQQAKNEVYALYTANRAFDLDRLYEEKIPAVYAKEYGKTLTEFGVEALSQTGLPYVLLLSQFSIPVERTYVTKFQMTETARDSKSRTFEYTVSVRFCLEKGAEAVAPEENKEYRGSIRMVRKGCFRWLLDGFTV